MESGPAREPRPRELAPGASTTNLTSVAVLDARGGRADEGAAATADRRHLLGRRHRRRSRRSATPTPPRRPPSNNLVRHAAIELAPHGILVNAIAPGPFPDQHRRRADHQPEVEATFASKVPLGRVAEPDELKGLALFLGSPASSYVTGHRHPHRRRRARRPPLQRRRHVIDPTESTVDVRGTRDPPPARRATGRRFSTSTARATPAPGSPCCDELARDLDVLRPDHPGLRLQRRGEARIDTVHELAFFYLDLLDELGLDRVSVIGCSLGGWVAADLATIEPHRVDAPRAGRRRGPPRRGQRAARRIRRSSRPPRSPSASTPATRLAAPRPSGFAALETTADALRALPPQPDHDRAPRLEPLLPRPEARAPPAPGHGADARRLGPGGRSRPARARPPLDGADRRLAARGDRRRRAPSARRATDSFLASPFLFSARPPMTDGSNRLAGIRAAITVCYDRRIPKLLDFDSQDALQSARTARRRKRRGMNETTA